VTPEELSGRIEDVRRRITAACARAGRDPAGVVTVAVTKGHGVDVVALAARSGLRDLGENYVQELERKRTAAPTARWHFLGRVQSNKAARVAAADVVHGLEPGRGADRLASAARHRGRAVEGLLEVDFTARRQGVAPLDVPAALDELRALEGIRLVGLMTIAPPAVPGVGGAAGSDASRAWFARLRELRDRHAADLPELSMGMSGDFPVAVEEGATMVRIGTALFGARPTS
jgi:hypothetical protein